MKEKIMVIPELAGLSVRLVDGTVVRFVDEGGGVREPRRPKPKSPEGANHAGYYSRV